MNTDINSLMAMYNKVEATDDEADAMYEALAKKVDAMTPEQMDLEVEKLNQRLAEADKVYEEEEKKRTPSLEWHNRPFSSL